MVGVVWGGNGMGETLGRGVLKDGVGGIGVIKACFFLL